MKILIGNKDPKLADKT